MKTNSTVIFDLGGWPHGRAMLGTIIKAKNHLGLYTVRATAKWGGGEWRVRDYEMELVCE